ncbi:hypothetical protein [Enterovirga sp.]|uniref:hypothetical protein n=1 Tax=Enterovirga sp. TaxID=2026350 RepID=UPI002C85D34A|nr:hypothetical protein [Enterovirga sp.]HMO30067.1 hypothetical protein [Enterovirga sp.]
MIYGEDLDLALARGMTSDIEDAFRALVGYPKEDDVEASAATLASLRACCHALEGSERIMPSGTIDTINDRTDAEGENVLLHGSTYGTGAARVLEAIEEFDAFLGPVLAALGEAAVEAEGGR